MFLDWINFLNLNNLNLEFDRSKNKERTQLYNNLFDFIDKQV